MAIAPTGAIYKSLIFDGEDSRDYGVYITGQAVFNAPEREVEMITIPARNGLFALDQGRFENIEVTYPAGIFADNDADFAQAMSDFRNFLCSRKGYCRLTDDYNPDEYRMAIYKSGLDVKLSELKAGEFSITFDCKPQRFLTSGETAVTVTSGNAITNPTLFESSPLLEVTGYGAINIGGKTVTVSNSVLGEIQVAPARSSRTSTLSLSNLNNGDAIYDLDATLPRISMDMFDPQKAEKVNILDISATNGTVSWRKNGDYNVNIVINQSNVSFVKRTSGTHTTTATVRFKHGATEYNGTITVTTQYDANTTVTMDVHRSSAFENQNLSFVTDYRQPAYYGYSTKSILPTPMYIDLDIGEAYGEAGGEMVSFNNIVSMPTELPVLESGANTITYDNTVTDLKIVPRWWKI